MLLLITLPLIAKEIRNATTTGMRDEKTEIRARTEAVRDSAAMRRARRALTRAYQDRDTPVNSPRTTPHNRNTKHRRTHTHTHHVIIWSSRVKHDILLYQEGWSPH